MNDLTKQQVSTVQVFRKINYVLTSSDGLIVNNSPKIYNISGTTEVSVNNVETETNNTFDEMSKDFTKVGIKLQQYNDYLKNNLIVVNSYDEPGSFNTVSNVFSVDDLYSKRFFMIMAQIFNNKSKFDDFKDIIITNQMDDSTPKLKQKFNKIVNNFRDKTKTELDEEEKFYKTIKKSDQYLDYVNQSVYTKGKTRKFTYSTIPNTSTNNVQISNLQLLYKGNNGVDNSVWTDKTQFN
jgi:hypothetical protein